MRDWRWSATLVLSLELIFVMAAIPGGPGGCPLSQFRCSTGRCVNLNVFCDGRNDCGDNSDEPAQCTHCNRTYYAGTGENYRLLVTWPKSNQMPFTCYLTFTSATHDPAELLQVRLDTATIGQYLVQSTELSGRCPDGWMQIWEGDQPVLAGSRTSSSPTGRSSIGAWCGASLTPRFYYTDSTAVTFVLRLLAVPSSLQSKILQGSTPPPVLDLTYKVLPRSAAVVRYGGTGKDKLDLGEQMAGTLCSRWFRQCGNGSASQCRVQSPGYPGLYPRNAHCLYRISHRPSGGLSSSSSIQPPPSPSNKRYVVTLWQNEGRKINLRDSEQPAVQQQAQPGRGSPAIRSAADCEASGDYITIYDGASTNSAVLVRFCDGPLPEVTSSGPDVTIEFRSSPTDTIFTGSTAIEGFELNVRILTIQQESLSSIAVSDVGKCQWNVTSSGLSRGILTSPRQTWQQQTLCNFRFQGRPDERVWIYFTKYHFTGSGSKGSSRSTLPNQQCRNSLRIADGDGTGWDPSSISSGSNNKTLVVPIGTISLFCREKPPPLCERHLATAGNQTKPTAPPCLKGESFRSNGSILSVQQHLPEGTAFSQWRYALNYEFYRPVQSEGRPLFPYSSEPPGCDRLFSVHHSTEMRGSVKSTQNVFLFGRGGARNLRCTYRFQGDETMRVAIEVTRLRLGGRTCLNSQDPLTHQRQCSREAGEAAFLQLQERPWGVEQQRRPWNVLLTRDCLCDTALLPFRYVSTGSDVEVFFQVDAMTHSEDYNDFFFEITYEFLTGMKCGFQSQLIRPLQGPGGLITLDGTRGSKTFSTSSAAGGGSSCNRQSWFLQPRADRFIFLSTAGHIMNQTDQVDTCQTKNRIIIYSETRTIICPSSRIGQDSPTVKIVSPTHHKSLDDDPESGFIDIEDPLNKDFIQSNPYSGEVGLIIEFIAIQSGFYQMKWLELTPQAVVHPAGSVVPLGSISSPSSSSHSLCPTWCPELKACIDSQLWCDGVYDCPSGLDESEQHCGSSTGRYWIIPKVYWYLVAAGTTLLVLFIIVSSVLVCRGSSTNNSRPRLYDVNGGGGNVTGGERLMPVGGGISSVGSCSGMTLSSAMSVGGPSVGSFRPPGQPIESIIYSRRSSSTIPTVADQNSGSLRHPSYYDKKLAVS